MENLILWALAVASVVCGVFLVFALFVHLPVALYAEAECLRAGYPKSSVTIGLERYCMTLDGSVTVKVTKQSK